MLMVVDADTTVARQRRQVLNHASLATGGRALHTAKGSTHTTSTASRQTLRASLIQATTDSACRTCSRIGNRRGTAALARFRRLRLTDSTSTKPTRRVTGSSTVVSTQGNAPRVSQKPWTARGSKEGATGETPSRHSHNQPSTTTRSILALHGVSPNAPQIPNTLNQKMPDLRRREQRKHFVTWQHPPLLSRTCTRANSDAAVERPPGCRTSFFPLEACLATSLNPGTRASSPLSTSADAGSSWVRKLVHRPWWRQP